MIKKINILVAIIIMMLLSLICGCSKLKWSAAAIFIDIQLPAHSIVKENNVMIPLRDGIRLAADIYRPAKSGQYPVVLIRTPYGKTNKEHRYDLMGGIFASHGYVVVVQDVRGRYGSEGNWYPFVNEPIDGVDSLQWVRDQEWSSGKVGMFGLSYFGSTQWLASPFDETGLTTFIPIVTAQSTYDLFFNRGVLKFNQTFIWHYLTEERRSKNFDAVDWEKALKHLPLIKADDALENDNPAYNDWIKHPVPDDFWNPIRVDDKIDRIKVPALLVAGWNDPFLNSMFEDYNRMIKYSGSDMARESQLIVGPWIHETRTRFDDIDYGKNSRFLAQVKIFLRWFDYYLKGIENGITDEGPISLFVMGKNQWRREKEWPLKRTRYVKYYLHSNGEANSNRGSGRLSTEVPILEKPDTYRYDPADPVPTIGGALVYDNVGIGPLDQSKIEARADLLVYSTPVLQEEMEITGPISLVLYASSSAKDTDFVARILDVRPDGVSIPLTTNIVRARFRESMKEPSFLNSGEIYAFQINLGATSNIFKKGHKIRLHVTSSDFPKFDRNLNTGAAIGMTSEMVKATQKVYHDQVYPSHLVMPVIPTKN